MRKTSRKGKKVAKRTGEGKKKVRQPLPRQPDSSKAGAAQKDLGSTKYKNWEFNPLKTK